MFKPISILETQFQQTLIQRKCIEQKTRELSVPFRLHRPRSLVFPFLRRRLLLRNLLHTEPMNRSPPVRFRSRPHLPDIRIRCNGPRAQSLFHERLHNLTFHLLPILRPRFNHSLMDLSLPPRLHLHPILPRMGAIPQR